jgi:predicted nucleotidyltransferase
MMRMAVLVLVVGCAARPRPPEEPPVRTGERPSSMLDALFPRTKQRVLALLFGQPERQFATTELIRLATAGSGAVQREIERLVKSGLVVATGSRTNKRFSANREAALYEELRAIVEKTSGVADTIAMSLVPLAASIKFAVLYGSIAKQTEHGTSDIDLLIVTDELTLEQVFGALERAEQRLSRRVSPTLYTSKEFLRRRQDKQPFLTKVLAGKHTVLFGTEDGISSR